MANNDISAGSSPAGTFGQDVAGRARDAKDAIVSTIEERVDHLPGGHKVKEFAQTTADSLNATVDYVRSHDARRMMSDVETVVRNNPGPALLVAAALGFVVGRAFVRD